MKPPSPTWQPIGPLAQKNWVKLAAETRTPSTHTAAVSSAQTVMPPVFVPLERKNGCTNLTLVPFGGDTPPVKVGSGWSNEIQQLEVI
jgi:hypothetical protein